MSQFQSVKMTYALSKEGDFVSVEHVSNGLACECVCIDCQGRLSAKQGKIKQWHFAHHQESDKENCQWSGESEIHLRVKKYLDQYRTLTVPIGFSNPTSLTIIFDDVKLEKSLRPTKRIPDVTGYCDGERILIEVKVTHEVDRQKASEYKAANASVVEIDFSDFTLIEDSISDENIERHLKRATFKWLSVAPVGGVAERFQDHERAIIRGLNVENRKLNEQKKKLSQEVNYKRGYINSFQAQYEECEARISAAKSELATTSSQIERLRYEKARDIEAARSSFTSTMKALEEEHLRHLDEQNDSKFERMREEFISRLKVEHKTLLDGKSEAESQLALTSKKLSASRAELVAVKRKVEAINKLEMKVLKEEALLKEKEQAWLRAASASASIRKHFMRMEPELRLICRKGGVPWPFNSNLLDELCPES